MDDVRYGFLGTLDHLPCEIIRTLWTVQSLELSDNCDEYDEERVAQGKHILQLVRQERERLQFDKEEMERFKRIKDRYDGYLRRQPRLKALPQHKPVKLKITMKSKATKDALQEGKQRQKEAPEVYCFCRDISYGPMIACDNEACPIEWFHYMCVGLTKAPRSSEKWFCSESCKKQAQRRTKAK